MSITFYGTVKDDQGKPIARARIVHACGEDCPFTARGTIACLGKCVSSSTCPTRASAMTGESLTIHCSATNDFCDDFIGGVLEGGYFKLIQRIDKFSA